jgi:hypothetical protein
MTSPISPSPNNVVWIRTWHINTQTYDVWERKLGGKYGNSHRCHCCTRDKIRANLFLSLISRTFMSISYVRNLWRRILIAVQVRCTTIGNISDLCLVACILAVRSYTSFVITHLIIHIIPKYANTFIWSLSPWSFLILLPHNQHNKSTKRWLISTSTIYYLWAIHAHIFHTPVPWYFHICCYPQSPHMRNNPTC